MVAASADRTPWHVVRHQIAELGPGLGVVLGVAVAATLLGRVVPIVGAPVFGIVLGAVLTLSIRPVARLAPGIKFAGKQVLQASIVLLGTGLSLSEVVRVGGSSLPVMLGTLAVALGGAWLFGRLLRVDGDARTLIGVGTGICGASAIAAVTAIIGAAEAEVAYAVGTIFTFNVIAVLLYPALGHLLGMSQHAFGLWSGTAINDTSSVVAVAYTYGSAAGAYGVVVKLTRTLMIIPISVALAYLHSRRNSNATGRLPWRRMFPLFILGFLATSGLDTVGAIPSGWHASITTTSAFLITLALAGIGMSTRISTLKQAGARPLLLGAILWVSVGTSSLLLQTATGSI